MLPVKFSWRIFLTTIILGIGIVFPLEIAYASFVSSSVNPKNSISSGYWITPTVAPFPTVTLTPVPTATLEPTQTPEPTVVIEPTETPVPTEITEPTVTTEPTITQTPVPTETVEPTATETPSPTGTTQTVVINEFMPKLSSGSDWVELYNLSGDDVAISNWKITDSTGSTIRSVPAGTVLGPGQFVFYTVGTALNNDLDDSILLKDPTKTIIYDSTSYLGSDVETDKSFGRETDGTGLWKKCSSPSQGLTNNGSC